jgi:thioesterase domain-containing protein
VAEPVTLKEGGALPPLYCVHPVSGSPYCYMEMTQGLGAGRPVLGLEAPGFDGEGEPAGSIPELAAHHVAAVRADRPHGPYHLLGWSLGGVVAYEMARLLTAAGERVETLVLIDSGVPQGVPVPGEQVMIRYFLLNFLGVVSGEVPGLDEALAEPGPDADLEERFTAVEGSGLFPEEFDADFLLERYLMYRAHASMLMRHTIEGGYDGPATLIKAAESVPELLDWKPFVGSLTEHTVPGDHHSMWTGPGLPALTAVVAQVLDAGAAA